MLDHEKSLVLDESASVVNANLFNSITKYHDDENWIFFATKQQIAKLSFFPCRVYQSS